LPQPRRSGPPRPGGRWFTLGVPCGLGGSPCPGGVGARSFHERRKRCGLWSDEPLPRPWAAAGRAKPDNDGLAHAPGAPAASTRRRRWVTTGRTVSAGPRRPQCSRRPTTRRSFGVPCSGWAAYDRAPARPAEMPVQFNPLHFRGPGPGLGSATLHSRRHRQALKGFRGGRWRIHPQPARGGRRGHGGWKRPGPGEGRPRNEQEGKAPAQRSPQWKRKCPSSALLLSGAPRLALAHFSRLDVQ